MTGPNSVQKTFCTTREAADLLGVSLRTAQLWAESGLLEAWKTNGGHRRITRESVERLLSNPSTTRFVAASQETDADTDDSPLDILVVEDETLLRHLYEVRMARWPIAPRVTTAGDGYEALIRIGRERPDLLVTDLHMPGMDGFRMLRTIRSIPDLSEMAIVVVSGLDSVEIEANGGLPEGITFYPKPIPFDRVQQIAERLAETLGRKTNKSAT